MKIPIFTCENVWGDDNEQKRLDDLKKKLNGTPKWETKDRKFIHVYMMGELEQLCYYDMPTLIDGTVDSVKYGNIQDCYVYDVKNKKHLCMLAMGYSRGNNLIGIIILKDKLEEFRKEKITDYQSSNDWDFDFLMVPESERRHIIYIKKLENKINKLKSKIKIFKERNKYLDYIIEYKDKSINEFLIDKKLSEDYLNFRKNAFKKKYERKKDESKI